MDVISRADVKVGELPLDDAAGTLAGMTGHNEFGDFDNDGDVDLGDYGWLQMCFTGENQNLATGCEVGDLNDDGAVDHLDASTFPAVTTGP